MMRTRQKTVVLFAVLAMTALCSGMGMAKTFAAAPTALKCEDAVNPFTDVKHPRLSWKLDDARQGAAQTAYQVLAASSPEKLAAGQGDLWDSGKVESDRSILVTYAGKPLESLQRVFWKVKTWDQDGKESPWSQPAYWEMTLLDAKAWAGAEWIAYKPQDVWSAEWSKRKEKQHAEPGKEAFPYKTQAELNIFQRWRFDDPACDPAPLLRKSFTLDKPIRQARAYICGLGYYELYLNGTRIGDRVLDPAWTDYSRRVGYTTYDVTAQLKKGANALGVMLGRGFYNPLENTAWGLEKAVWRGQPKMLINLRIEYADGSCTNIVSSPDWKVSGGPVMYDDPHRGEIFDARQEIKDWNKTGFDDSKWAAVSAAPAPAGVLEASYIPPIRAVNTFKPVSVSSPQPGVYVFRFSRVISGWPRLKISGPAGTEILVTFNERFQQYGYILAGGGEETFEPRFCYTAFDEVTVSGVPQGEVLTLDSLTGVEIHTDFSSAGRFECANQMVNDIHQAVRNTIEINSFGIATDCATREKLGMLSEFRSGGLALRWNFDAERFHLKICRNIADSQNPNGVLPLFAPTPRPGGIANFICQAASMILMPWEHYLHYGDSVILQETYNGMQRWMEFVGKQLAWEGHPSRVMDYFGDWLAPQEGLTRIGEAANRNRHISPEGQYIYGSAYYYRCAVVMASIARTLGKNQDAAGYDDLAQKIKTAFNEVFYDPETKCYRGETREVTAYRQSANAMPLSFGLVPDERKDEIIQGLVTNLKSREYRIGTGIKGTPALLKALPDNGQGEVAYRVVAQTNLPGWGHMIRSGSQHIWERWTPAYKGHIPTAHQGFCSVGDFFYRELAGIQPAEPGFKRILFAPIIPAELDWVKASYECPYGIIRSEWSKQADGTLEWNVTVPPNTSAAAEAPQGWVFGDSTLHRELMAGSYELKLRNK